MAKRSCDNCKKEEEKKNLGKIRGKYYCKKCRKDIREKRRKEILNSYSEKEKKELEELSLRAKRDYNKAWRKQKKEIMNTEPKINGSKEERQKKKSNAYLNFEDRKQLLRIIMSRGATFEEAKEELNVVLKRQRQIRDKMKEERKTEKEIKEKQREMLEELWRY